MLKIFKVNKPLAKWYYDQIFTWNFMREQKCHFTVCKSVLDLETFKFEKRAKYANEITDDVIHSAQYYIS